MARLHKMYPENIVSSFGWINPLVSLDSIQFHQLFRAFSVNSHQISRLAILHRLRPLSCITTVHSVRFSTNNLSYDQSSTTTKSTAPPSCARTFDPVLVSTVESIFHTRLWKSFMTALENGKYHKLKRSNDHKPIKPINLLESQWEEWLYICASTNVRLLCVKGLSGGWVPCV